MTFSLTLQSSDLIVSQLLFATNYWIFSPHQLIFCLSDIYWQRPDSFCTNIEFPPNQRTGPAVSSLNDVQKISIFWCNSVALFLVTYRTNMLFVSLCRGVNISVLRHEAEFYGITPLGMLWNKVLTGNRGSQVWVQTLWKAYNKPVLQPIHFAVFTPCLQYQQVLHNSWVGWGLFWNEYSTKSCCR